MRPKLSYANVVATVALFVALGGSAAAVATLTGRDIKNRSIKKVDVGRNALTGGEIREDRLAKVPSAVRADTAGFAERAGNASLLGGIEAAGFARGTQIDSGAGDNTSTTQTTLLSFPEIGLEIHTDGDADATNSLRAVNSRTAGRFLFWNSANPVAVGQVGPGVNFEIPPGGIGLIHDAVFVLEGQAPQLEPIVVSVTCRFNIPPTVACIGISSP